MLLNSTLMSYSKYSYSERKDSTVRGGSRKGPCLAHRYPCGHIWTVHCNRIHCLVFIDLWSLSTALSSLEDFASAVKLSLVLYCCRLKNYTISDLFSALFRAENSLAPKLVKNLIFIRYESMSRRKTTVSLSLSCIFHSI